LTLARLVAIDAMREPLLRWCRPLPREYVQLEMFPEARHIEAVDPRVAIGPTTRVSALYRVRYGEARVVHQVYHDRHGWYCAEHGPACSAVVDATQAAGSR
jgi:hypothetical protein